MRGSRIGRLMSVSSSSGSRAGVPRMNAAATIAPTTHEPPRKKNAGRVPPRTGRRAAPSAPPIGIAVCRIPSARPSSPGGNQLMIARPLAAFTLAPSAPAAISAPTSEPNAPVSPRRAERHAGADEAGGDHPALVEPVGEQTPREERAQHPDADRGEHDAGLAEREPVVRADLRGERGQPDRCGREARLREGACSEDHPAIARARISLALADFVRRQARGLPGRPSRAPRAVSAAADCRGRRRAARRGCPRPCSRGGRGSSPARWRSR